MYSKTLDARRLNKKAFVLLDFLASSISRLTTFKS